MLKLIDGSGRMSRREGFLGLDMTLLRNIFWVNVHKMDMGTRMPAD